jgi:DNA-binding phage protein
MNNTDWLSDLKFDIYPGKGIFHATRDVIEREQLYQAAQMWMMLENNNPQRRALLEVCRALAMKGVNEALKALVARVLEEAQRNGYQHQVQSASNEGQSISSHIVQEGC